MSKSKRKLMIVIAGAILLGAGVASAGYRNTVGQVRMGTYTDGSGYAAGVLSIVRSSSDNYQRISCYSYPTSGGCLAFNYVNNSNGVGCTTQDPAMLAVIRSLNGDSYLYFSADSTGACTNLYVQNASEYQPKNN